MSEAKTSAGVLLFRDTDAGREVLLAHFGGPFFASKDLGSWQVPKGEVEPGEALLAAALREFTEELGCAPPAGPFFELGSVRQKSGKVVHAWAVRGDFEPSALRSNTFELEWPKGSGTLRRFQEIDRVEWFTLERAVPKLNPAQLPFLERVKAAI